MDSPRFIPLLLPPDEAASPAYWFFVGRGSVAVVESDEPPVELMVASDASHFIGTLDGRPCWCAGLPPDVRHDGLTDLRALYAQIDELVWTIAGRAVQIVEWERTHRFCGRCGAETIDAPGERARRCGSCGLLAFPRLAPAVITVVTRGDELLLARNTRFPPGMFSALAGFVEPGEGLEDAVRREVFEEVGVQLGRVQYFGSQPWPFPHSLMIGFLSEWLAGEINPDPTEIAEAAWFPRDALPNVPPRMSIARRLIDAVVNGEA